MRILLLRLCVLSRKRGQDEDEQVTIEANLRLSTVRLAKATVAIETGIMPGTTKLGSPKELEITDLRTTLSTFRV